jgi:hypothetical protein
MTSVQKHSDYLKEARRLESTLLYMDMYINDICKQVLKVRREFL